MMKIETVADFKALVDEKDHPFLSTAIADNEYVILNTTPPDLLSAFENLSLGSEKAGYFFVAVYVQHEDERTDTLIFCCRREALTRGFFEILVQCTSVGKKSLESEGVFPFLENQWQQDNTRYPFLFLLTTRQDWSSPGTMLSHVAIAPHFRQKGLMKRLSLSLIEQLTRNYGDAHEFLTFPIHPAPYLLLYPKDKELKAFFPGSLESRDCGFILQEHGLSSSPVDFLGQSRFS